MTEGNCNVMDPTGWIAEKLEWFITYYFFANDEVSASKTCIGRCTCDDSGCIVCIEVLACNKAVGLQPCVVNSTVAVVCVSECVTGTVPYQHIISVPTLC